MQISATDELHLFCLGHIRSIVPCVAVYECYIYKRKAASRGQTSNFSLRSISTERPCLVTVHLAARHFNRCGACTTDKGNEVASSYISLTLSYKIGLGIPHQLVKKLNCRQMCVDMNSFIDRVIILDQLQGRRDKAINVF